MYIVFPDIFSFPFYFFHAQSRQLAAIMFTDIVGYTAILGNDEQKTFDLLNKNRQIRKSIIEQFNDGWIKGLGDGINVASRS